MIKIGNTIKRLRRAQKLTLTEMANLTSIHLATLSRMENNKMIGPIESHMAIAKVLGFKLSEYFEECEKGSQVSKVSKMNGEKTVASMQKRHFMPILIGVLDIGQLNGNVNTKTLRMLEGKSRFLA